MGNVAGTVLTALPSGQSFPSGLAMNAWLGTVGALVNGELPLVPAFHNADVSATNTHSKPWIVADNNSPAPGATQYFSSGFPTAASAEGQCGHLVYSELHDSVGPGVGSGPDYPGATDGGIVPGGCSTHPLTPQEKALEFVLFDLSSCLPLAPSTSLPQPPLIDGTGPDAQAE